jgi:sec-independent protein translocase protein TatA
MILPISPMALTDPFNLLLILGIVVVFLLWGPAKIPELAKSLGQAKREFEKGSTEGTTTVQSQPQIVQVQQQQSEDELIRVARMLGVPTEGKDRKWIADEIAAKLKAS